jgi:hypothetical protein
VFIDHQPSIKERRIHQRCMQSINLSPSNPPKKKLELTTNLLQPPRILPLQRRSKPEHMRPS